LADRIDQAGDLEPDAAGQVAAEQAAAEGPVGRGQTTSLHLDANLARARRRHLGLVEPEHIGRVAVAMEAKGAHSNSSVMTASAVAMRTITHA
jgi:hypothetical protein